MKANREPNGRDRNTRGGPDRNDELRIQRVREGLTWEQAGDPLAAIPLGQALLKRYITEGEFEAGEKFATVAHRFWRLRNVPQPHAKAAGGTGGGTSAGFDGDLAESREKYERAQASLRPLGILRDVENICAYGRTPSWLKRKAGLSVSDRAKICALRQGLDALAKIYRIKSESAGVMACEFKRAA